MDFSEMTDGQILVELKRHLTFCELASRELTRRANEPEIKHAGSGDRLPHRRTQDIPHA